MCSYEDFFFSGWLRYLWRRVLLLLYRVPQDRVEQLNWREVGLLSSLPFYLSQCRLLELRCVVLVSWLLPRCLQGDVPGQIESTNCSSSTSRQKEVASTQLNLLQQM